MKKIVLLLAIVISLFIPATAFAYSDVPREVKEFAKHQDLDYQRYNDISLFMRKHYNVFKDVIEPWDRMHNYRNYVHPNVPNRLHYYNHGYCRGNSDLDNIMSVMLMLSMLAKSNDYSPPVAVQENITDMHDCIIIDRDALNSPELLNLIRQIVKEYDLERRE